MKKQVKIISILLIVMIALTSISTFSFATTVDSALKNLDDNKTNDKVMDFGKTIVPIVRTVGVIAAVVILMVVGIKYMLGSAEEKAEYKKTIPAYVIGAILVFAASQIIAFIVDIAGTFGNK